MNTDPSDNSNLNPVPNPVLEFRNQVYAATPRAVVTPLLIALNFGLFLFMVSRGVSPWDPSAKDLIDWGANFGPMTTSGDWWRLLSSIFIHVGIVHLLLNMFALWVIGRFEERLIGNSGFLVLYLVSGVFASLTSVRLNPISVPSAGASGAIFGICGAVLAYLVKERSALPPTLLRRFGIIMAAFIILNVAFGLQAQSVDLAAHLGGLAAGFGCGMVLSHPFTVEGVALRWRRNLFVAAGGAVLVLACAIVMPKSSPALARALVLMEQNEIERAIKELDVAIAEDADSMEALQTRALCFVQLKEFPRAVEDFTTALAVRPSSITALFGRAQSYSYLGRYEEALADLDQAIKLSEEQFAASYLPVAYNTRGFAFMMLDRDAPAEDDWRKAAEMELTSKSEAGQLENIGLIHLKNGEWRRALDHAAEIEKLAPDLAWNNLFKSIAASELGEGALAQEAHARWTQLKQPDDLEQLNRFLPESLRPYLQSLPSSTGETPPKPAAPNTA